MNKTRRKKNINKIKKNKKPFVGGDGSGKKPWKEGDVMGCFVLNANGQKMSMGANAVGFYHQILVIMVFNGVIPQCELYTIDGGPDGTSESGMVIRLHKVFQKLDLNKKELSLVRVPYYRTNCLDVNDKTRVEDSGEDSGEITDYTRWYQDTGRLNEWREKHKFIIFSTYYNPYSSESINRIVSDFNTSQMVVNMFHIFGIPPKVSKTGPGNGAAISNWWGQGRILYINHATNLNHVSKNINIRDLYETLVDATGAETHIGDNCCSKHPEYKPIRSNCHDVVRCGLRVIKQLISLNGLKMYEIPPNKIRNNVVINKINKDATIDLPDTHRHIGKYRVIKKALASKYVSPDKKQEEALKNQREGKFFPPNEIINVTEAARQDDGRWRLKTDEGLWVSLTSKNSNNLVEKISDEDSSSMQSSRQSPM